MYRIPMVAACCLLAVAMVGCGEAFEASLTAGQVVPATSLPATGRAVLVYHEDDGDLDYKLKVDDTDRPTSAYVYLGAENENGEAVLTLYSGTKAGVFSGELADGTATAADLKGSLAGKDLEELIKAFREDRAYVQVNTEGNPNGAIRGEIDEKGFWKVW